MIRSAWAVSGIAVAAVMIAAVAGAALWWIAPAGRLGELQAAATLTLPIVLITLYCATVGFAILVWIRGALRASVGMAVALGVGVSSVAVLWTYRLLDNATVVVWVLLAAALVSIALAAIMGARREPATAWTRAGRRASELVVASGDLVAVAVAGAVMLTVARFGAAAWTTLINDFHRYAGSAMIWLADSGVGPDFATKFTGNFGSGMAFRASHEKPGATALILIASQVTGLAPYELLAPLSILLLALLVSCLLVVLRRGFGLSLPVALVCAIPPTVSLIPMSRVFDAQLGQLAAAALLAAVLALISVAPPVPGVRATLARGALVGVLAASAIAVNATLVLSFSPAVAVVAAWIAARSGWTRSGVARYVPTAVLMTAVASLPFLLGYVESLNAQTGGGAGIDVPFPLPSALLGLQTDLAASSWVPWAWAALGVLLVVWLLIRRPRSLDARFALATIGVSLVIVVGLGLAFGFENYSVHKWVGLWISVIAPILLAAAMTNVVVRARVVASSVLALASVAAILIATNFGYRVGNVVSPAAFAISGDERLAQLDTVNVDTYDLYLNSLASLAVPSREVRVVDTTYALADAPIGSDFLISPKSRADRNWHNVTPVSGDLSLAQLDLTVDAGTIEFGSDDAGGDLLFGSWYPRESSGTWSSAGRSLIVFDVASSLRGSDLTVVLDGSLMAGSGITQLVKVQLYDGPTRLVTATEATATPVTLTVPHEQVTAHNGRVVVSLTTARGVSPAQALPAGTTDDARKLGYGLRSMTLMAGNG